MAVQQQPQASFSLGALGLKPSISWLIYLAVALIWFLVLLKAIQPSETLIAWSFIGLAVGGIF